MIRTLFNEVFKAAENHINIEGMPLARGDESRTGIDGWTGSARLPLVRGDESASASTGRIIPGPTPRKRG